MTNFFSMRNLSKPFIIAELPTQFSGGVHRFCVKSQLHMYKLFLADTVSCAGAGLLFVPIEQCKTNKIAGYLALSMYLIDKHFQNGLKGASLGPRSGA